MSNIYITVINVQIRATVCGNMISINRSIKPHSRKGILEDENGNALWDAEEVLDDLDLGKVGKINPVSDQLKSIAQVYMNGSFASLTDGKTAIDGSIGKIGVTI